MHRGLSLRQRAATTASNPPPPPSPSSSSSSSLARAPARRRRPGRHNDLAAIPARALVPMYFANSIRMPGRTATAAAADRGATAVVAPSTPPPPTLDHQQGQPVVVGCGSCGVDYLAAVAAFPRPDEKLRTEALESQGGGNAANALTAAARLCLRARLVSKVGGDGLAEAISAELRADGVDDAAVLRASAGVASPFTYIIVDRTGGTRTCIHTPLAEPLRPEELSEGLVERALAVAVAEGKERGGRDQQEAAGAGARAAGAAGTSAAAAASTSTSTLASVAYFDGRMADAAIRLARAARAKGVPVLVEGERPRPGLDDLLACADVVCTSAHFPREWTGKRTMGEALAALARRLPRARALVTTLGAHGAVMLAREGDGEGEGGGEAAAAAAGRRALLSPPAATGGSGGDGGAVVFLPERPEAAGGGGADPRSLDELILELKALAVSETAAARAAGAPAAAAGCDAGGGAGGKPSVRVRASVVAATPGPIPLLAPGLSPEEAASAAESAERAAAMNADAGNARAYAASSTSGDNGDAEDDPTADAVVRATVLFAPAALLPSPDDVVDTTGAGDAFIGSIVYALAKGLPAHRALRLATVVAAAKCTALGARPGLPMRSAVDEELLL